MNNPLALTLIRDTYQSGDDARELLDFSDSAQQRLSGELAAEEITGHLLDRVLPAAYARRPGQPRPRYDYEIAKNAFNKIAARMVQDGVRDLQWWRIPKWAPTVPRTFVSGLVAGVVVGLVAGIVAGLAFGLTFGLVAGLLAGLLAGWEAGIAAVMTTDPPRRIGRLRLRRAFNRVTLMFGLGGAVLFGLTGELAAGLVVGLVVGLVGGLMAAVAIGVSEAIADPDSTSAPSPSVSWHDDRRYATVIGLVFGLVFGLVLGLTIGLKSGPMFGLVGGLVGGVVAAPIMGILTSKMWPSSVTAIQLARRWHTPVNLMKFLDDARERNVLRTVGPVYQFRHASLQDRLAAANSDGSDNGDMTNLRLTQASDLR